MRRSLEEHGQLTALVVFAQGEHLEILDGFERVRAAAVDWSTWRCDRLRRARRARARRARATRGRAARALRRHHRAARPRDPERRGLRAWIFVIRPHSQCHGRTPGQPTRAMRARPALAADTSPGRSPSLWRCPLRMSARTVSSEIEAAITVSAARPLHRGAPRGRTPPWRSRRAPPAPRAEQTRTARRRTRA